MASLFNSKKQLPLCESPAPTSEGIANPDSIDLSELKTKPRSEFRLVADIGAFSARLAGQVGQTSLAEIGTSDDKGLAFVDRRIKELSPNNQPIPHKIDQVDASNLESLIAGVKAFQDGEMQGISNSPKLESAKILFGIAKELSDPKGEFRAGNPTEANLRGALKPIYKKLGELLN